MFDVIIIGAGLAGLFSALKIPRNLNVLLIESGSDILPITSSSYNECYKLHTGVHYVGDADTAENCLIKSIEFAREFPDYIAGGNDLQSPWRRGRHYFMSNSLVPIDKAREIAIHLQEIYSQLVIKDVRNKLFGEPEYFIQFLIPEDYSHIREDIPFYDSIGNMIPISVALGIETAESQIDIYRLKTHLQQCISLSQNITFLPSTTVTNISHHPTQIGYIVTTKNEQGDKHDFISTSVINCSWQNVETLDRSIGMYVPDENRVIRIKASILIELPESLRHMNTCIFSSGPYCSMTVLPNGTAILTSERTTNIGYFKAGESELTHDLRELIHTKLNLKHPYGQTISEQIRKECASYLIDELNQQLCDSTILELHIGYVKIIGNEHKYTNESIYQANSVIHARQQDGIEVRDLGYISNSGMKMTYTVGNAIVVANILDEHLKIINKMNHLTEIIKEIMLPLLGTIKHHEKNINSILYINYRERLKYIVLSDQFSDNPRECAKNLADELMELFKRKETLMNLHLRSIGLFLKKSVDIEQDTLSEQTQKRNL